jgi:ABC-type multidrug transport system fused ATPase/permease subunit
MGIVAQNIKGVQESCASVSDYFNLYNRKPQMDFSQSIQRPPISQIQGKIEFKNVYFSYPSDPDKKLVLNGINLNFEPGKKIALVGESGCGKSTIVNLIERLYDITGGQLLYFMVIPTHNIIPLEISYI